MAFKLPESREIKARLRRVLRPKSKLGRTTLWFGGLALVLELLRLIFRAPNGTMLSGWATLPRLYLRCLRPADGPALGAPAAHVAPA